MKTSILISILIFISSYGWTQVADSTAVRSISGTSPQEAAGSRARTTLGIRGGINYVYIKNMRTNAGFLTGAFARFNNRKWYIEPSVNISQLRIYDKQRHTSSIVLDIPVVVGYNLVRSKNFDVRLFAGPIISIPLDKKSNKNLSISNDSDDDDDDDKTTGWDIILLMAKTINGIKAGVGITIGKALSINGEYARRYNFTVEHPSNVLSVTMEINLRYYSKSIFRGYK